MSTTESPVEIIRKMAIGFMALDLGSRTSYEKHLRLLFDGLYLIVSRAIMVCRRTLPSWSRRLHHLLQSRRWFLPHHQEPNYNGYRKPNVCKCAVVGELYLDYGNKHTCNLPLSSRSPLSLTKTISSNERRTKSSGSDTAAVSASPTSAMVNTFKVLWIHTFTSFKEALRRRNRSALARQIFPRINVTSRELCILEESYTMPDLKRTIADVFITFA